MAFGFDPAYSAFLRAMGVEEQAIRSQARMEGGLLKRQVARQEPIWQDRISQMEQGVRGDAEARGTYTSGATVRDLAQGRNRIGLERAEQIAIMRDKLQQLNTGAATSVAALRRQGMEQALSSRTRNTERAAQAVYGNRGSFYR